MAAAWAVLELHCANPVAYTNTAIRYKGVPGPGKAVLRDSAGCQLTLTSSTDFKNPGPLKTYRCTYMQLSAVFQSSIHQ